jgi:hypothetical protein
VPPRKRRPRLRSARWHGPGSALGCAFDASPAPRASTDRRSGAVRPTPRRRDLPRRDSPRCGRPPLRAPAIVRRPWQRLRRWALPLRRCEPAARRRRPRPGAEKTGRAAQAGASGRLAEPRSSLPRRRQRRRRWPEPASEARLRQAKPRSGRSQPKHPPKHSPQHPPKQPPSPGQAWPEQERMHPSPQASGPGSRVGGSYRPRLPWRPPSCLSTTRRPPSCPPVAVRWREQPQVHPLRRAARHAPPPQELLPRVQAHQPPEPAGSQRSRLRPPGVERRGLRLGAAEHQERRPQRQHRPLHGAARPLARGMKGQLLRGTQSQLRGRRDQPARVGHPSALRRSARPRSAQPPRPRSAQRAHALAPPPARPRLGWPRPGWRPPRRWR